MLDLQSFANEPFLSALRQLFVSLRIPVNYISELPADPADILGHHYRPANPAHALIQEVYALGMVDDAAFENPSTAGLENLSSLTADYDGILIFGVMLKSPFGGNRGLLADITRAFNRAFPHLPVVVVFRYGHFISIANAERLSYLQNWREGEKIGKVSLLKDIDIMQPHAGHLRILDSLRIASTGRYAVTNFAQLYYYWQGVFSISVLNKAFYQEIIKWFEEAIQTIKIPSENTGSEKHKDFTVRLIARFIFIWFLKELGVVKKELLTLKWENGLPNEFIKPKTTGSAYYKFILQNLFFNALNCEQKDRNNNLFDIYADYFTDIETLKEWIFFSPYLNGGLFDIHPNDWCSEKEVNNAFVVPDALFLDPKQGLIALLERYKFTIAENTPIEEEIAVDPEMLGRIFENLLAEQSDDTKEAARKNAGAFYTPRPVVAYMCRSTLLKHLDTDISPKNAKEIIHKILETTVLDPACGSGAFPMGMLEEMMQVLNTVDPNGNIWAAEMMKSKDEDFRNHIAEMFADGQINYVKKLGILRNCLFGLDLLEYAIEITKLRCWLSLIVEQKVDFSLPNYNLKPLPNLEFKFYKKNSLYRFYKNQNLNKLIEEIDNEELLKELVNLENQYFIAKSDRSGSKEQIKRRIIELLERLVDTKSEEVTKKLNALRNAINQLISSGRSTEKEIAKLRKQEAALANELAELAVFRQNIKDYFIETIVFPGIFNKAQAQPGFDIVIGNPPYVNTKLISKMGQSQKMEEEYGYCDDLYNHFTIRGLELLKPKGLLSYITSDTFLTLQTKKNMRVQFLGVPQQSITGEGLFAQHTEVRPLCHAVEIINTPKAFAALVDTAIYTLKKQTAPSNANITYIDLRRPNAQTFGISEEEWQLIKASKENITGWERVLERTFAALGHQAPDWVISHSCDGDTVFKDNRSSLLKYQLPLATYRNAINFAIFSPTPYNCQILEKIVKPARPVYDTWWEKIETSAKIELNRRQISTYTQNLKEGSITLLGLLTDGGQGLATGNNGSFVGYQADSRFAARCRTARAEKLYEAILKHPEIRQRWTLLEDCHSAQQVADALETLPETEVWRIFDDLKGHYDLRLFGKGFLYRIIPPELVFDLDQLTDTQKTDGIEGTATYVPYDKGDKEGNRWYLQTPYLIDWSVKSVKILSTDPKARWQGYNFFFRNGFCWNESLNPNSNYIKCRLKQQTVNDVSSMSLYEQTGLGDEYVITQINSYVLFKVVREFLNNTVKIQINDIRKLPIKLPTEAERSALLNVFEACLSIKKQYFAGQLERHDANALLKPYEAEIDRLVNQLYGIEISETVIDEDIEVIEAETEDDE